MTDDLPVQPLKPDLVYNIEPVPVPDGPGVIFTLLRRLPIDGSWEIAWAGRWGNEWSVWMPDEAIIPDDALDPDKLVREDWHDDCETCGHSEAHDIKTRLVYARPTQPKSSTRELMP